MFTLLFIHLLCNSTLFPSFNNFRFHLFCLLASLNVCAVLPPTWCGWHLYCSNSVTLICEARSEWVNSFTYSKCHHTRVVFFICSAIYRYGYYLTIDCCFFRNKTKTRCHLWLCLCLNRSMRVLFIFYSKARKSFFSFCSAYSVALSALQVRRRLYAPLTNFDTLWRGDLIFRRIYIAS